MRLPGGNVHLCMTIYHRQCAHTTVTFSGYITALLLRAQCFVISKETNACWLPARAMFSSFHLLSTICGIHWQPQWIIAKKQCPVLWLQQRDVPSVFHSATQDDQDVPLAAWCELSIVKSSCWGVYSTDTHIYILYTYIVIYIVPRSEVYIY